MTVQTEETKKLEEKNNDNIKQDEEQCDRNVVPAYTIHNGYRMAKGFPIEGFDSGLQYSTQPNDLFVATYPKCGTTYMQNIVYLILNDGKPFPADEQLRVRFPHLERHGSEFVAENAWVMGGQRLIKTHLPYDLMPGPPAETSAKYIYVCRNAKDCCVSSYKHTKAFENIFHFKNGHIDTYYDLFLKGETVSNDIFHHIHSWYNHRNDPNILFVLYEDLRKDARTEILKVAKFIDPDLYPAKLLANNEKILNLVLEQSSIESMKKDPQRWTKIVHGHSHIGEGKVQGWSEWLKPEQAEALNQRMKDTFPNDDDRKYFGTAYYG